MIASKSIVGLCVLVFGWISIASAHPAPIGGLVVGVHDGDSITVLTPEKQQIKVRLEGIDAPELGQPFGKAAKEAMSSLVFGKAVVLHPTGTDRYKRTLAVVMVGAVNVNLAIVRLGFAWRYDAYSKDEVLLAAQNEARDVRRGLWDDPSPVPPWLWRKKAKS